MINIIAVMRWCCVLFVRKAISNVSDSQNQKFSYVLRFPYKKAFQYICRRTNGLFAYVSRYLSRGSKDKEVPSDNRKEPF